jgi:hypothetical protein
MMFSVKEPPKVEGWERMKLPGIDAYAFIPHEAFAQMNGRDIVGPALEEFAAQYKPPCHAEKGDIFKQVRTGVKWVLLQDNPEFLVREDPGP